MNARYMPDALRDLAQAEAAIKSNRRQVKDNPKPASVKIAEAVYPSLLRKRDAVLAEIAAGLPDRPANPFAPNADWKGTVPPSFPACCISTRDTPLTPEELDGLAIPAQFKRDAANRLPGNPEYGKV